MAGDVDTPFDEQLFQAKFLVHRGAVEQRQQASAFGEVTLDLGEFDIQQRRLRAGDDQHVAIGGDVVRAQQRDGFDADVVELDGRGKLQVTQLLLAVAQCVLAVPGKIHRPQRLWIRDAQQQRGTHHLALELKGLLAELQFLLIRDAFSGVIHHRVAVHHLHPVGALEDDEVLVRRRVEFVFDFDPLRFRRAAGVIHRLDGDLRIREAILVHERVDGAEQNILAVVVERDLDLIGDGADQAERLRRQLHACLGTDDGAVEEIIAADVIHHHDDGERRDESRQHAEPGAPFATGRETGGKLTFGGHVISSGGSPPRATSGGETIR